MRRLLPTLIFGWMLFALPMAVIAQDTSDTNRKVVSRAMPQYPAVARSMHLGGVVKVEAVVAPNGSVKNVALRGGPPILATAATDAVRKWKWTSGNHETHEIVELKFDPNH